MYRISFKADLEPAYVPDELGRTIYKDWLNDTMPEKIEIEEGRAILSSTIRAVEGGHSKKDNTEKMVKNMEELATEEKDYLGGRFQMANLPAQEKGKNMNIPSMVWWAETGIKEMPSSLVQMITEKQTKWFMKHPRHAFCNPTIYREEITKYVEVERLPPYHLANHGRAGIMAFVERVLHKDQYYANR